MSERLITEPPALPTVLFDGHCRFCIGQMETLARFLPRGAYRAASFQEPEVLEAFPGVTHEMAMKEMLFVDARGRVFGGAEAAVQALKLRLVGRLAGLYYVPGLRQLLDLVYAAIARNRYKLAGEACDGGTCALHAPDARGARSRLS